MTDVLNNFWITAAAGLVLAMLTGFVVGWVIGYRRASIDIYNSLYPETCHERQRADFHQA